MKVETSILLEIFEGVSFEPRVANLIESTFEKVEFKKGTIILRANEMVHNQYYVDSGCLRTYYTEESGKEHTIQFAIKNWWISDYTAFFSTEKATMSIECIQDATLYKVSKEQIENWFVKSPELETFFRRKLEKAFTAFQKRIISNLSQSATQKYLSFLDTYPQIEKSVKNYHIASYLGITTESLSRIRKEITSK